MCPQSYPVCVKHFLVYSGLRLLVLLAVGGLAFAVGLRGWVLLVVAFVGSGALSIFVLSNPRNKLGADVGGVFHRINDRIDAATRAEDQDVTEPVAPTEQVAETDAPSRPAAG